MVATFELYFVYKSITMIVYVHHPLPALLPSYPPTRLLSSALSPLQVFGPGRTYGHALT